MHSCVDVSDVLLFWASSSFCRFACRRLSGCAPVRSKDRAFSCAITMGAPSYVQVGKRSHHGS